MGCSGGQGAGAEGAQHCLLLACCSSLARIRAWLELGLG